MSFISGLFSFLNVVFFICLIIGLIKPSIFNIQTRFTAFSVFFVAMLVSTAVVSFTMPDEQKTQIEEERKIAQIEEEAKVLPEPVVQVQENNTIAEDNNFVEPSPEVNVPDIVEEVKSLTRPQQNAVRSANQYLSVIGFSRKGLIDQLSSSYGDGYDQADATIAVDSLNVDWNEQAARSATQYLEMTGFSCNGLIEQLSSSYGDKYTKAQATYGAQYAGACS